MKLGKSRQRPLRRSAAVVLFGLLQVSVSRYPAASNTNDLPADSAEFAAIEARFDPALEALVDTQAPLLGTRWAGAWWHSDGTVTVGITDGHPLPSPLATDARIRIARVRFSVERLEAAIETVTTRLNPLLAPDVELGSGTWPYVAKIELDENIVEVEIDKTHESKQDLVETVLADELSEGTIRIIYGTGQQATALCGSRTNCTAPFRGGTQNYSSSACTLGFVMTNATGQRFQSTASHCQSNGSGTNWFHAGRAIGPTHWTEDAGDHDFLVIRQNNESEPAPTNWVYRNNNTATVVTTKLTTLSAGQGAPICTLGVVSNEQCGTVTNTNRTINGRSGWGEMSTAPLKCRGDSGAAIINPTNNRAYGIVMGWDGLVDPAITCTTGLLGIFTWLTKAEAASQTQLLDKATSQTLGAGQQMPAGYALVSPDGTYNLQMQGDGNLVLRSSATGVVWQTNTTNNPGSYLVMQYDGHLVLYAPSRAVLWHRPTSGWVAKSYLELQNDGNLVVYTESRGVRWHLRCNCTSMP